MLVLRGGSVLLSLLFVPIFLKALDPLHYGIWVTIFSLVNWISFFDLGLGQGLRNKLTENIAKKNYSLAQGYVSTAYAAVAVIFLSVVGIFLVFSLFINWAPILNAPQSLLSKTNTLIIIVFVFTAIGFIPRLFNAISMAMHRPAITYLSDLVSQILCLISVIVITQEFFQFDKFLSLGFVFTLIPSGVLLVISVYFFSSGFAYIAPKLRLYNSSHLKGILSLGGNFFFIQILWMIITQSNSLFIANLCGPAEVGEYYLAFRYFSLLSMGFAIVLTPIWSACTEAYVNNDFNWIKVTVRRLFKLVAVFALVGLVMLIGSKLVFEIWIQNQIHIRWMTLMLVFLYTLLQMIWMVFGSVINGFGKIRLQLYASIISAILHVVVSIGLGKIWGISGILVASIISTGLFAIWSPIQYNKLINSKAKGIWAK